MTILNFQNKTWIRQNRHARHTKLDRTRRKTSTIKIKIYIYILDGQMTPDDREGLIIRYQLSNCILYS